MLFRASLVVLTAVAAVSISHKKHSSEKDDPSLQHNENEEKYTDHLSAEEMQDKKAELIENRIKKDANRISQCKEFDCLRVLEDEFQQRKGILEKKLIKLYSLKEKQSDMDTLRNNLDEKIMQIDMLNVTVNMLQVQRNDLQKEIKEGFMAEQQLRIAKRLIEKLQKKKLDANEKLVRGQLMRLQEQVSGFQTDEFSNIGSEIIDCKRAIEDVELECIEMRRKNKELELEKRELVVKLVAGRARISSLSNLTEGKTIAKVEEELNGLKLANQDLSKEVERMQKNRFDMVEELVYQRWLNACLRFEIQNSSSLSRIHNGKLNQKPLEKSKPMLILLDDSISSQTSLSDKNDSSITTGSSSSSQNSSSRWKSSLIHNIKKSWGKSKDNLRLYSGGSPLVKIRRFSTSIIPSKSKILSDEHTPFSELKLQDVAKTSQTSYVRRARRRVSFSESTRPVISKCQEEQTPADEDLQKKELSIDTSEIFYEKLDITAAETPVPMAGNSIDVNEQQPVKNAESDEHTILECEIKNAYSQKQHLRKSDITVVFFIFWSVVFYCLLLHFTEL